MEKHSEIIEAFNRGHCVCHPAGIVREECGEAFVVEKDGVFRPVEDYDIEDFLECEDD